jgi:cation diffusion facilitator family transporter
MTTKAGARRGATDCGATHRSVVVYLVVNVLELVSLGIAAWVTDSVALRAQTAANAAEIAVELFLLIGVLSSGRPADPTHPLGYGRERFFWSLMAALGICLGGSGVAFEEAIRGWSHPALVHSYTIGYVVLAATVALDTFALAVALRPVLKKASENHVSLRVHLRRSTDPASITVVVGGGCAVIGGVIAALGLLGEQLTRNPGPDTAASGLIGLLLLVASLALMGTNRELLSGRGLPLSMVREMSQIVAGQPGVVDVPDLFGIVIGPSSFIVDGDVTFDDNLDVPAVEQTIMRSTAALQERWPSIEYVYLTPVPKARPRRGARFRVQSAPT